MMDEKYPTMYLAVYGKILQIHLHDIIQISRQKKKDIIQIGQGGSQSDMKLFEYLYKFKHNLVSN